MEPVNIQDTPPEDHDTLVKRTWIKIRKEKDGKYTLWLGMQGWKWAGEKCMPMCDALCLGVCTEDNIEQTLSAFRQGHVGNYIFEEPTGIMNQMTPKPSQ
jgi:hypothetical protein